MDNDIGDQIFCNLVIMDFLYLCVARHGDSMYILLFMIVICNEVLVLKDH